MKHLIFIFLLSACSQPEYKTYLVELSFTDCSKHLTKFTADHVPSNGDIYYTSNFTGTFMSNDRMYFDVSEIRVIKQLPKDNVLYTYETGRYDNRK